MNEAGTIFISTNLKLSQNMNLLNKNQMEIPEVKNLVTEINNLVDGFHSALDTAEDRISNLEERLEKYPD